MALIGDGSTGLGSSGAGPDRSIGLHLGGVLSSDGGGFRSGDHPPGLGVQRTFNRGCSMASHGLLLPLRTDHPNLAAIDRRLPLDDAGFGDRATGISLDLATGR